MTSFFLTVWNIIGWLSIGLLFLQTFAIFTIWVMNVNIGVWFVTAIIAQIYIFYFLTELRSRKPTMFNRGRNAFDTGTGI